MADNTMNYTMDNYGQKSAFASFLPGISGVKGIPIWCYYVNRGQGVVSFGVENKDHAIMEFYPAHQAYQNVKITGFRTFINKDGNVTEAFRDETVFHSMHIEMNGLNIEEVNKDTGLTTKVSYFTLPGERIGALVRKVTICNTGDSAASIEVLDGMPACIPYGIDLESLKTMGQTMKAWMQVEYTQNKIPFIKARASTVDSAAVTEVTGGNFAIGCLADGSRLHPITDPEVVFAYDLSLDRPVNFKTNSVAELNAMEQVEQNLVPCSFFGTAMELAPGEEQSIYELFGQVDSKEILEIFGNKMLDAAYFDGKKAEAVELVNHLGRHIRTKTANADFDAYCQYTYMDNVLRGGYPIQLTDDKVFYVYSRKHGDLERDYNFFSMLPEFYSQGNGNFRDVNQNRRCDTFFAPFVKDENVKTFYSLIQPDGYNPLGVEKVTYQVKEEKIDGLFPNATAQQKEDLKKVLTKPFTPGALYKELDKLEDDEAAKEVLFGKALDAADGVVNGNFLEGYWSDHWTYNLDLIENYLSVYPEKEEELFFDRKYTYFVPQAHVNKRDKRCVETPNGIRQYRAIEEVEGVTDKLLRTEYGKGEILYVTLLEKLLLLCATKFAALDAYGMGVEMEGGKPGWYDALNGLPGLFGSSMSETYELGRNLEYTIEVLKKYSKDVEVIAELAEFIENLDKVVCEEESVWTKEQEMMSFWNKVNDVKEAYRAKVYAGVSGENKALSAEYLVSVLEQWHKAVRIGIDKACAMTGGICPTYFSYTVTEYTKTEDGIMPLHFEPTVIPLFLEGPVRYLKLDNPVEKKKELYHQIKNSDLYDEKLSMYKVNASLADASYEIGRAKAFTPGWLENESIWLHMEYKYLLELLKSEMYEEFFADFEKALIPFLDKEVYGRSVLENSSFIASSKNPNKKYHGKGFVARLSGSTVEFLNMWQLMMFGQKPFDYVNGELTMKLAPAIPAYLVEENMDVEAVLLGETKVTYHVGAKKDYFPGQYEVSGMVLKYMDGSETEIAGAEVTGSVAMDVREGKVAAIEVTLR